MRPSALLLTAAAASLGFTSAAPSSQDLADRDISNIQKRACFKSGVTWGDERSMAYVQAQTACSDYFVGNYEKGRTWVACYPLGGGKSVEFRIALKGRYAPQKKYLGWDECVSGLNSEIGSCSRGGQTTYGNWYYRADPNKGGC